MKAHEFHSLYFSHSFFIFLCHTSLKPSPWVCCMTLIASSSPLLPLLLFVANPSLLPIHSTFQKRRPPSTKVLVRTKPRLRPSATFGNPLQASSPWNKHTHTDTQTHTQTERLQSLSEKHTNTDTLVKYKQKGPIISHFAVHIRSVHVNLQCDIDKTLPALLKIAI